METPSNHKQRTSTPHSLELYSFPNFMAYALYSPLYIAGPIMTFNDFVWQVSMIAFTLLTVEYVLISLCAPSAQITSFVNALRRSTVFLPIPHHLPRNGTGAALHVRRRDQGYTRLDGRFSIRAQYGGILEFNYRMDEGSFKISFHDNMC